MNKQQQGMKEHRLGIRAGNCLSMLCPISSHLVKDNRLIYNICLCLPSTLLFYEVNLVIIRDLILAILILDVA